MKKPVNTHWRDLHNVGQFIGVIQAIFSSYYIIYTLNKNIKF